MKDNLEIKQGMLAAIVDSSDDIIISENLDGIVTSWNKAAEKILGFGENEVLGKHISIVIPEILRDEEITIIDKVKKGDKVERFQTVRLSKDGKQIPLSITFSPIKSSSGEIIGTSKIARNISAQLLSEEKQGILASIVDSSDDAIISKNLSGVITSWNRSAERLFGYSENEIIGQHINILIPLSLRDEEHMIISKIKKGEKVDHFETTRLAKDGRELQLSITVSPVRNGSGQIIGASKIARDISQLRIAEVKQGILAAIVDSSDDAIISKNLSGIITSWNSGAERLFGYKEHEAIGKSINLLIPEERLPEEQMIIGKIKQGKKVDHFETVRRAKDGRALQLSITVSPVKDSTGKIIGASKIARDISAQIKMRNDQDLYTKRLEKLNGYKDEFIGMASHELKTPLTSINANLQLLERKVKDKTIGSFVSKTLKHVKKLTGLVSDLLDVTKIQEGKLQLNCGNFEINELIEESIESVQIATPSHKIIYKNKLSGEINADRQRIEQVIVNLLTNAIKYSPGAAEVIVEAEIDMDQLCIAVKDFGIGIPAEQQQQIFSRFYRVDDLAPTYSGLGIGLYISGEIVKRHKGKIWVESELNKGSVFKVRLPLN